MTKTYRCSFSFKIIVFIFLAISIILIFPSGNIAYAENVDDLPSTAYLAMLALGRYELDLNRSIIHYPDQDWNCIVNNSGNRIYTRNWVLIAYLPSSKSSSQENTDTLYAYHRQGNSEYIISGIRMETVTEFNQRNSQSWGLMSYAVLNIGKGHIFATANGQSWEVGGVISMNPSNSNQYVAIKSQKYTYDFICISFLEKKTVKISKNSETVTYTVHYRKL